ncbi:MULTISPECIES: GNAT family N-acetyltransferase [Aquitalea]|uniref:GNAT family N-acetyltransferase n=1 Tax=Aquitalea TaxID=407217 RepID=UPI00135BDFBD|nr:MULTISPECIES: GNAT family N-acetyltransferase [Aquitalea]
MTLKISPVTAHQLEHCLPLFQAYLAFYAVEQSDADCLAFLEARLHHHEVRLWLAEDAGVAVGFALMYPGFNSLTLKPNWLLHDLYVVPEYRGSGVSRQLLQTCQAHVLSQGGGDIMLQTAHDNTRAQRLYEGNGFVLDKEFRVYYWDGKGA